jgi:hypothetical protein
MPAAGLDPVELRDELVAKGERVLARVEHHHPPRVKRVVWTSLATEIGALCADSSFIPFDCVMILRCELVHHTIRRV